MSTICSYEIYISDTAYTTGDYLSLSPCITSSNRLGLGLCSGTGQYLIFVYKSGSQVAINDFRVYDKTDLAHTASSITSTGVTIEASESPVSDMVGLTDGIKECTNGDNISGNEFAITLAFSTAIQFTDVIVFINYQHSGIASA